MSNSIQYKPIRSSKQLPLPAIAAGLLLVASSLATSALTPAEAAGTALKPQQVAKHQQAKAARVIVSFVGGLSPGNRAQLASLGCDIYRNLSIIHSAALSVPQGNLGKLSALSFVKNVTPDVAVSKCDAFTMAASEDTQAYSANTKLTGSGVTVAVLDSGIQTANPDLAPATGAAKGTVRALASVSMIGGTGPAATNDQCGHGTHVAGIIGGNGAQSSTPNCTQTFYGIARNVNLVNVRVLDGTGAGVASNVIAGLQWCITNKALYKIGVINLSLGAPVTQSYKTDPLCQAAEAAWKAGIVVVCAAGNDGRLNTTTSSGADNFGYGTAYGSIHSPGNDPYVITVGATKQMDSNRADDLIASYSSRGPTLGDCVAKPDIVAAGNKIISTLAPGSYIHVQYGATNALPVSTYQTVKKGDPTSPAYFVLSGTSMAAPVVSGAAALLLQEYPTLTPDTVKARLMMSADEMSLPDGSSDICTYGAGYLDIPAALASTVVATSPAMSPTLFVDASGNVEIADDQSLYGNSAVQNANGTWSAPTSATIWGTGQTSLTAIYGSRALWGDTTVSSSRALWGDASLSSSSTVGASRALWGDTSLYASRALWGDTTPHADLSTIAINGE